MMKDLEPVVLSKQQLLMEQQALITRLQVLNGLVQETQARLVNLGIELGIQTERERSKKATDVVKEEVRT